jgi:cellulose synthase/poly-beta-1,6-N-acetylglucosamine synthase-like glycosyltransferase
MSWNAGIVIPARDEETSIAACLHAVVRALESCRSQLSASWIVVVADSCSDGTAAVARKVLGERGTVIECGAGSPGVARRLGTAEVLSQFRRADLRHLWLANTDADSCVSRSWLSRQLVLANQGYCGVAGIVRVDTIAGLDKASLDAVLAHYTIHDDGTHPHVHGANLGVRGDAYVDAGCWSNLAVAEDHCLWSRLRARGWPTKSCSRTVVHTSGRLQGRATGGFADALRARLEVLRQGAAA